VTTEFDLGCATCGGSLQERTVAAEQFGVAAAGTVDVAECPDCGDRYVPEHSLDLLQGHRRN